MTEIPGLLSTGKTFASHYSWIADKESLKIVMVEIDHAAVDGTLPATYPTGLLRSGLVLGKVTVGGEYKQYSDAAGDGTEVAAGILLHPCNPTVDDFGNALAAGAVVLAAMVVSGFVDGSALYGIDAAGRVDLKAQGMVFKDSF